MEIKYIVALAGVIGITILDAIALLSGIDGSFMVTCSSIIGGIIGGLFGFEFGLKKKIGD